MQTFRLLLSQRTIPFLHEPKLLHSSPLLSLSAAADRFSPAYQPIISCLCWHSFHSGEQHSNGEEVDPAARVWTFYDPVAEQIVTSPVDRLVEEKIPQKGNLEIIKRVSDGSSEEDEAAEHFPRGRSSWPSRAAGRVGGKKNKGKSVWVCRECGADHGQWWGTCPSCKTVGTVKWFVEAKVDNHRPRRDSALEDGVSKKMVPQSLADVSKGMNQSDWRIPLCEIWQEEAITEQVFQGCDWLLSQKLIHPRFATSLATDPSQGCDRLQSWNSIMFATSLATDLITNLCDQSRSHT